MQIVYGVVAEVVVKTRSGQMKLDSIPYISYTAKIGEIESWIFVFSIGDIQI